MKSVGAHGIRLHGRDLPLGHFRAVLVCLPWILHQNPDILRSDKEGRRPT